MKKLLALLVVLGLIGWTAGCKDTKTPTKPKTKTGTETKAPETDDIEKLKEKLKQLSTDELWSIAARELAKLNYRPPGAQG